MSFVPEITMTVGLRDSWKEIQSWSKSQKFILKNIHKIVLERFWRLQLYLLDEKPNREFLLEIIHDYKMAKWEHK